MLWAWDLVLPPEILRENFNDVFRCQSPLLALHFLSLGLVVENVKLAGHTEPDVVFPHFSGDCSRDLVFDDPPDAVISLLHLQVTLSWQITIFAPLGPSLEFWKRETSINRRIVGLTLSAFGLTLATWWKMESAFITTEVPEVTGKTQPLLFAAWRLSSPPVASWG